MVPEGLHVKPAPEPGRLCFSPERGGDAGKDRIVGPQDVEQLYVTDVPVIGFRGDVGHGRWRQIKMRHLDIVAPAPMGLCRVRQQGDTAWRDRLLTPLARAPPVHGRRAFLVADDQVVVHARDRHIQGGIAIAANTHPLPAERGAVHGGFSGNPPWQLVWCDQVAHVFFLCVSSRAIAIRPMPSSTRIARHLSGRDRSKTADRSQGSGSQPASRIYPPVLYSTARTFPKSRDRPVRSRAA